MSMAGSPADDWPRVQVHPGTGVVDRHGDTLVVVPVLPASRHAPVRELVELCRRTDPTGSVRIAALRALLDLRAPAEVPGFALLIRTGHALRVLLHGPVQILLDGRPPERPGAGAGRRLTEHLLTEHLVADGAWHGISIAAEGAAEAAALPADADVLPLDLESGTVPGAGVTLHGVPAGRPQQPPAAAAAAEPAPAKVPTSMTALRPAMTFRSVLLGECADRGSAGPPAPGPHRPPLPVAGPGGGAAVAGTTEPEVLVEGTLCPAGHFTDPESPACPTCGAPLPPGGPRVVQPRPPLGIVVTDGGTIYTVTGDYVIGREAEGAPEVLAGRARPLPLRDAARSTSRVHASLSVRGWKVLLSDNGSANGTFLSRSGAAGPWLPVTPQFPVALAHGDRIRLGKRQLLYDTWRATVVPQVFR